MAWPIAYVLPSLLPLAAVGIWGAQASTRHETAVRAGCENPASNYAKGMEDIGTPHALPKAVKNLSSPLKSSSDSSFGTPNRKMEEAGSRQHPGIQIQTGEDNIHIQGWKGFLEVP